ncbi:MAG: hypothetical protein SPL79_10815 [Sphaerochaetaceae bacterium]|nr:hypothetical protein [Sphaerochaetaceae bacterium]
MTMPRDATATTIWKKVAVATTMKAKAVDAITTTTRAGTAIAMSKGDARA